MIITHARSSDVPRLVQFRTDASLWLAGKGVDQWSTPFPVEQIEASVKAGEVFLIRDGETGEVAATVTLDRTIDPELWDLWTPAERAEDALYVHKLTVDRRYAGQDLGGRILDWAGNRAARQGARWLRLDAWTTNRALHRYYLRHGFEHVRTTPDPDEVSGWLAQRLAARADHRFDDRTFPPS